MRSSLKLFLDKLIAINQSGTGGRSRQLEGRMDLIQVTSWVTQVNTY